MDMQQVSEGLTATQGIVGGVVGTLALLSPFVAWLLVKRSEAKATQRTQSREDRKDALEEWQFIAADLRKEQDADRKDCDERITKLECRVSECESDRSELRAKAAETRVRLEFLEAAVGKLQNGGHK